MFIEKFQKHIPWCQVKGNNKKHKKKNIKTKSYILPAKACALFVAIKYLFVLDWVVEFKDCFFLNINFLFGLTSKKQQRNCLSAMCLQFCSLFWLLKFIQEDVKYLICIMLQWNSYCTWYSQNYFSFFIVWLCSLCARKRIPSEIFRDKYKVQWVYFKYYKSIIHSL